MFSHAGGSAAALDLLKAGSFRFHARLQRQFPQENWDQLFSSCYTACKLAIATGGDIPVQTIPEPGTEPEIGGDMPVQTIPEPGAKPEVGRSSRGGGCHTMLRRLKGLFKSSKS